MILHYFINSIANYTINTYLTHHCSLHTLTDIESVVKTIRSITTKQHDSVVR